jgi:leucyl/phenylalanyl-tRNA--protein transferase
MRRTLKKTRFTVTSDRALGDVMKGCAAREEGTWLTAEMQEAYSTLAAMGHASSYEVWDKGELVGGLYGVLVGGLYAAESKFHVKTDASKIALACAVTDLFDRGVRVFDVQFVTDHLRSLGVHEVSRDDYLSAVSDACTRELSAPCPELDLLPRVRSMLELG